MSHAISIHIHLSDSRGPCLFHWGKTCVSLDRDFLLVARRQHADFEHLVRIVGVGQFHGRTLRKKRRQFHVAYSERRTFAGDGAFAFDNFHNDTLHICARRAEGISRNCRDRIHLADHWENIFFHVRFIPQDNSERVRRNVGELNQAAFA